MLHFTGGVTGYFSSGEKKILSKNSKIIYKNSMSEFDGTNNINNN